MIYVGFLIENDEVEASCLISKTHFYDPFFFDESEANTFLVKANSTLRFAYVFDSTKMVFGIPIDKAVYEDINELIEKIQTAKRVFLEEVEKHNIYTEIHKSGKKRSVEIIVV